MDVGNDLLLNHAVQHHAEPFGGTVTDPKTLISTSGGVHFVRSAEPHVPRWIQLTTSVAITRDRQAFEAATFPWSPELRMAANIKNGQQLDALRRIHDFLASGGASRCLVPIKERSVELFGDEKMLFEKADFSEQACFP